MNLSASSYDDRSDRRQLILVAGCFLLSGFAALLYETVWLRQFSIHFGTSEQALAIVLGTYMGGLALGSLIASRVAGNLRRPLLTYGLLELGIAATALLVPVSLAFVRQAQVMLFGRAESPPEAGDLGQILFSFAGALAATILPTTMMGATLPMLAKHVVHDDEHLGNRIGALYSINTLGAVLGTLASAFVLLPRIGLLRTVFAGAAINLIVFLVVWLILRAPAAVVRPTSANLTTGKAVENQTGSRQNWILWLIACSGAVSFAYEILFTRMLGHFLGGSVFAFASMLASFLMGIALGGAIASRFAKHRVSSATGFFMAQCATILLALMSWFLLEYLAGQINRLAALESSESIPRVLCAIAILMPPAISIGMTFPWAIRIHARDERDAAKSSAKVYAWNTVGCVIGAFVTGTYLLPMTNYQLTMLIALAANLMIALTVFWLARPKALYGLLAVVAVAVMAVAFPQQPNELLRVSSFENYVRPGELVLVRTGRSATVTLHNYTGNYYFSTNGLPEAGASPKGSLNAWDSPPHWMGVLPAILRPQAKSMLVVGFGSGVTPASAPRSIRDIDVFELEEGIIEANRVVSLERDRDPLSDPRINIILNDGRGGLALTRKRYDIIVSQPSHPFTAGASHLYTREFASLVKSHLNEHGVFLLWIDGEFADAEIFRSLGATLGDVFTNVCLYRPKYSTFLFVGSQSELGVPAELVSPENAGDKSLIQRMGLDSRATVASALALDNEGLRRLCAGALPTTDNNNLLALRRIDQQRIIEESRALNELINQNDPWIASDGSTLDQGIDPVVIVQRRIAMGRNASAALIADQIADPSDRLLALGYVASAQGNLAKAADLYRQSVQTDPGNQRAWIYRLLQPDTAIDSQPADVQYETLREKLSDPYRAVADAIHFQRTKQLDKIQATDDILATIPSGDSLFGLATLLRIQWRDAISTGGSPQQLGRQTLELIDRALPHLQPQDLYMFRLKAAAIAARPHIVLSTAQAITDDVRQQLRQAQANPATLSLTELNVMRLKLLNCLTAIDAMQGVGNVTANRYYSVRMYVEAQLHSLNVSVGNG